MGIRGFGIHIWHKYDLSMVIRIKPEYHKAMGEL